MGCNAVLIYCDHRDREQLSTPNPTAFVWMNLIMCYFELLLGKVASFRLSEQGTISADSHSLFSDFEDLVLI